MLVLLSLLAAIGFAQNCQEGINANDNTSQKRRQCKKLAGCKWMSAREEGGNEIPGECAANTSCGSLSHNQCKKRNNCYINWTANGRPCEDYNPNTNYPCGQLGGKRNQAKCDAQDNCIRGSGDRQNKVCLTIPANLQDRPCEEFNGKPNKYLCNRVEKCTWNDRGLKAKTCVLKRKPEKKSCTSITNEDECLNNPNGCSYTNNQCRALNCNQITDRTMCNASDKRCTWSAGMNAKDYDISKNKQDQKLANKNTLGARDGFCQNGVRNCDDIMTEDACLLSQVKHGLADCRWNKEAKEMNRPRCSTRRPCSFYTKDGRATCLNAENMDGNRCVYQLSGDVERCMEFACDDARLDTKNKCNTVGCHWHRNKDKRDPNSQGYCGILDFSKGRRL